MRWTTLPRRLAFAAAFLFTMSVMTIMARSETIDPPAVSTLEAMKAASLSPEALAAADLVESASDILENVDDALELRQTLKSQQDALQSATNTLSASNQAISEGAADQELMTAHAAAVSAFEGAKSAVASTIASLRSAALDGVSSGAVTALNNWSASSCASVPSEFRIKSKTPDEWKQVVGALRAEARCSRKGTELDSELVVTLSSLRTDEAVIAAQGRLTNDLAGVQSAFDAYAVVTP